MPSSLNVYSFPALIRSIVGSKSCVTPSGVVTKRVVFDEALVDDETFNPSANSSCYSSADSSCGHSIHSAGHGIYEAASCHKCITCSEYKTRCGTTCHTYNGSACMDRVADSPAAAMITNFCIVFMVISF